MSFLNVNKYLPLKYILKLHIFQYELRQRIYDAVADPSLLEKKFFEDNTDLIPVSVYQSVKEHVKMNIVEMSSVNMFICISFLGLGILYMKDLQNKNVFNRMFVEEDYIQFMKNIRMGIYILTVIFMNNVDNAL